MKDNRVIFWDDTVKANKKWIIIINYHSQCLECRPISFLLWLVYASLDNFFASPLCSNAIHHSSSGLRPSSSPGTSSSPGHCDPSKLLAHLLVGFLPLDSVGYCVLLVISLDCEPLDGKNLFPVVLAPGPGTWSLVIKDDKGKWCP